MMVLTTGCPYNEYIVELQPQGEKIERTLSCRRLDNDGPAGQPKLEEFPAEELKRLQSLYPSHRYEAGSKSHVLRGAFTNNLPKDVGGAGQYQYLSTSLGSVSFYLERFRGLDDMQARLERRMKATDQLADLVAEWLQSELGQHKNFPQLKQFLDGPFHKDLKNLNFFGWQVELVAKHQTNNVAALLARATQYLWEHEYIRREDMPQLLAGLFEIKDDKWLRLLQALLADKLGVPRDQQFSFLKDSEALDGSFKEFLPKSNLYQARLTQWKKEHLGQPAEKKPAPDDFVDKLSEEAFDFRLGGPDDKLTVKLGLPAAPMHTNGKWDAAKKVVIWTEEIESEQPVQMPVICYALWVEAAEDFQKAHFGKMALHGEALNQYVLWRVNLPADQGKEWDKFVSSLAPGGNLLQRLEAFKFSTAKTAADSQSAEFGATLLKAALATPER